ncbi:hypothetical protein [Pseudomonas phage COT4]|uniref:Uncharacterized protein n=1 Tax=Pseudomonas phage M5.1 TaxID=2873460 RepID=A0AAE8XFQ4_9CAUD|nr:hypothetical protein QGX13_gp115 [Pseudomonas phage M5.1]UAV89708.1 hypothetical protein M51_127 [Pseudomonas phage M5.1]UAV89977.1 hypothetical protein REC_128 [Pseudomonas phage REC]UGL61308.1 hypothetical protein [Pseudomonas phage COT4]UGL62703.1 hypothetical protein [Pseudomonas phage REC1]
MTTRTEPGFFSKKAKTPDVLANEALQAFTDAQAKLVTAQEAIAAQKAEHEAEIASRQAKLTVAEAEHSRLERIKGRFAELLS